jgi:hypothetical protein
MKPTLQLERWYTLRDGTFAHVVGLRETNLTADIMPPDGDPRRQWYDRREFAQQVVGVPTRTQKRAWKLKWIQRQIAAA